MTKRVVISQFLLSVILGKNGVPQKLGKLPKGSACLQRLRTTGLKRNPYLICQLCTLWSTGSMKQYALRFSVLSYRIIRTVRRTKNSLIFSKIESAPYNAVRLRMDLVVLSLVGLVVQILLCFIMQCAYVWIWLYFLT